MKAEMPDKINSYNVVNKIFTYYSGKKIYQDKHALTLWRWGRQVLLKYWYLPTCLP